MPLSTGVKSIAKSGSSGIRGNVTLSEGTNITLTQSGQDISIAAAGGGSIPTVTISTIFETSGRFSNGVGGSGVITYGTSGMLLNTSSGTTSYCDWGLPSAGGSNWDQSAGNPQFAVHNYILTQPTDGDSFFGIGLLSVAGTGITYTGDHMGYKLIYASSALTISATNADGTTETATAISGITVTNENFWFAIKNGTTNIKYYVERVLKATHTTNLMNSTIGSNYAQLAVSNKSVNTQWRVQNDALSVKWDMQ